MNVGDWREDLRLAAERLRGRVLRTPLLASDTLSRNCGAEVRLKCESLQRSGSFKFRPALNGILERLDAARARGVVASSSGNFAGAVALAAKESGVRAVIVMLAGSSPLKVERTRALGAEVRLIEDDYEARQRAVDEIVQASGSLELHPHSSRATIAGDAVMALEITEQLGAAPGSVLVPVSGGGLLAGLALGFALQGAATRVIGVQPRGNTAFAVAHAARERRKGPMPRTMADGIQATLPGELGFGLALDLVGEIVIVEEAALLPEMARLAREERLVVEPSGALTSAALSRGVVRDLPSPIVCVLSGGNVDPRLLAQALS